jgi:hypothetical protein
VLSKLRNMEEWWVGESESTMISGFCITLQVWWP